MIGMDGLTRTSSATEPPSNPNAEFGAVSKGGTVFDVVHALPVPTTADVQPAGKAGAVTPSKFCEEPQGPVHTSFVVHALPSSQAAPEFVNTQPVAGLQVSVVQVMPSLQTSGVPATHAPPAQASPVVHAFPSVQGFVLFAKTHVSVVALHVSVVHGLPSLQWTSAVHAAGTQSISSAPTSGAVAPPLTDPAGPGRVWLS
jgi:hypothetical protein